jgi:hypothetical protein
LRNGRSRTRLRDELRIRRDVLELRKVEKMMQNVINRRWLLAGYPEGMPTLENWTLDRQPVPDPGPGQILVKAKWISVGPGCCTAKTLASRS